MRLISFVLALLAVPRETDDGILQTINTYTVCLLVCLMGGIFVCLFLSFKTERYGSSERYVCERVCAHVSE